MGLCDVDDNDKSDNNDVAIATITIIMMKSKQYRKYLICNRYNRSQLTAHTFCETQFSALNFESIIFWQQMTETETEAE